jgi:hypothetical protein
MQQIFITSWVSEKGCYIKLVQRIIKFWFWSCANACGWCGGWDKHSHMKTQWNDFWFFNYCLWFWCVPPQHLIVIFHHICKWALRLCVFGGHCFLLEHSFCFKVSVHPFVFWTYMVTIRHNMYWFNHATLHILTSECHHQEDFPYHLVF